MLHTEWSFDSAPRWVHTPLNSASSPAEYFWMKSTASRSSLKRNRLEYPLGPGAARANPYESTPARELVNAGSRIGDNQRMVSKRVGHRLPDQDVLRVERSHRHTHPGVTIL